MKFKILDAISAEGIERKIQKFISNENKEIEIKDIQISSGFLDKTAVIKYED